jgi:hypothetical protein
MTIQSAGKIKNGARWSWASIGIFVVACAVGPLATILQAPEGGDETMAAAINSAIGSGIVFLLGLIVAAIAFARERERPVLRWFCLLLYLIPILGIGLVFCLGLIRK